MYLGIMMSISQEYYFLLSVIGQHIVFIISLFYLQRMIEWFTCRTNVARLSILGFTVVAIPWHNSILTESFAISGNIFFFYCLLAYYKRGKSLFLIGTMIWLAFLVFLRPSFLFLFFVCLLALGLYYRKYKKRVLWGLLGLGILGLLELEYCNCIKEKFGTFIPSEVGIDNSFQIAIIEGALSPDYSDIEEIKQYLTRASEYEGKNIIDVWNFWLSDKAPEALTIPEKAKIIAKSRKEQPEKWARAIWLHYKEFLYMHFPKDRSISSLPRFIVFSIELFLHGFVILYFVFCIYTFIIKKKCPVISIILWAALMGNVATFLIGAQAEWYRLFLPSIPVLLLIIIHVYSVLCKKVDEKKMMPQ